MPGDDRVDDEEKTLSDRAWLYATQEVRRLEAAGTCFPGTTAAAIASAFTMGFKAAEEFHRVHRGRR